MKLSIGIDVSKRTLDVVFFDGEIMNLFTCENNKNGMAILNQKMKRFKKNDITVTMEATGNYHLYLATYLHSKGYTVSVINPLIIKRFSEMKMMRAKTDSVDARIIAEYGFEQKPSIFTPKPHNCQKIIYYLKAIEDLLQMKAQNTNRLEALSFAPDAPKELLESFNKINEFIIQQIKESEKAINRLVQETNEEQYNQLMKIPGVGKRTAVAIIGYFNDFEYFETAKQVVSYIGVNPSPRMSGTSVRGTGSISRKGNPYLRKLFYMAALSASKHNDSCIQLYNRMLLKGKDKKLALIAVANKLIRQVFAVTKYKREYVAEYHL